MAIDDTCFWLGQPINVMTREQLQDALIECKLALMLKQNEVIKLRYLLGYHSISSENNNEISYIDLRGWNWSGEHSSR